MHASRVEQRLMLAGMLVLPGVQVAPKRLSTQSRLGIVLSHIMYLLYIGWSRRRLNCFFPPRPPPIRLSQFRLDVVPWDLRFSNGRTRWWSITGYHYTSGILPDFASLFFGTREKGKGKNPRMVIMTELAFFFLFLFFSFLFFVYLFQREKGRKNSRKSFLLLVSSSSYGTYKLHVFRPRAIYQKTPPCSLRLTLSNSVFYEFNRLQG